MLARFVFVLMVLTSLPTSASATTYYVDYMAGSNRNPGTQASPWKTPPGAACVPGHASCQELDSDSGWRSFASGDSILLKAGTSFPMIWLVMPTYFPASPASTITLDRYGTGDDPIIEGGETVAASAWLALVPNVYAFGFDPAVKLYSPTVDQPHMYRSGVRWALNGTIDRPSKATATSCTDLSTSGEMFFDPTNKRICVYSTTDPRADGSSWYVGYRRLGIYVSGVKNVTIRDLHLRRKGAIPNVFGGSIEVYNGADNVTVDHVTVEQSGGSGIRVFPDSAAVRNFTLRNSSIYDAWAYGVEIQNAENTTAAGFLIENNESYDNGDHGISCNKINGCTVRNNHVHDNAIGQAACGSGACGPQQQDRGSGLTFTGAPQNLTITANVVDHNGRRAITGDAQANGIYLLDVGGTNLIANNVVHHHIGMGIALQGTVNGGTIFRIMGNTVVDNDTSQLMEFAVNNGNGLPSNSLQVIDNQFVRTTPSQYWANVFVTSRTVANGQLWDSNNVYDAPAPSRQYYCGTGYSAGPCVGWDFRGQRVDPRFVSVTTPDYHLQLGSPSRDAGTMMFPFVLTDADGRMRPQGLGWDIGAYEGP